MKNLVKLNLSRSSCLILAYLACLFLVCSQSHATDTMGLSLSAPAPLYASTSTVPITAIIGAFGAEVNTLEEEMPNRQEVVIMGLTFVTGTLQGRHVVLVQGGIGKVNAAEAAVLVIEHFHPKQILFTGVAGGINPALSLGDVVIGSWTVQSDHGLVTPKEFELTPTREPARNQENPIFFPADVQLLALARKAAAQTNASRESQSSGTSVLPHASSIHITEGVIASNDTFIAAIPQKKLLRTQTRADAVEMEGAAVAQVCWQQGVPCLVIRGVSDRANDTSQTTFQMHFQMAADHAALLISHLVGLLAIQDDSSFK